MKLDYPVREDKFEPSLSAPTNMKIYVCVFVCVCCSITVTC